MVYTVITYNLNTFERLPIKISDYSSTNFLNRFSNKANVLQI